MHTPNVTIYSLLSLMSLLIFDIELHLMFEIFIWFTLGRAIRHVNDYAAILLVDIRYASDSSKRSFSHPSSKLPQWIKDSLVSATKNYGEVHKLLHQFFRFNKNRNCN